MIIISDNFMTKIGIAILTSNQYNIVKQKYYVKES